MRRPASFLDYLTDLLAFAIVGVFVLVVTHLLGWWGG